MKNQYHNTRANEFDRMAGDVELALALDYAVGDSVLDIGCGIGELSKELLDKFQTVVGLDLSEENIAVARRDPLAEQYVNRLSYVVGNAETVSISRKFSTILMSNILEHVDNPVVLLRNAALHLEQEGRILVVVPNAWSLNRQLGYEMGLIKDVHELSQSEIDLYGHQRVYDPHLLKQDIISADLHTFNISTFLFKPFTNSQMWEIMKEQSSEWQAKFMKALLTLGYNQKLNGAAILAVVEHKKE